MKFIINYRKILVFVLFYKIVLLSGFNLKGEKDDFIIKFNIENIKYKTNEYVNKIANQVKKEMKKFKKKLSYMTIPDDLDIDNSVKIYENENINTLLNNTDLYQEDNDNSLNEFEEKDLIKSIFIF